jgi:hypothetical protein
VWPEAAEELHDDMAVVVFPALHTLPAAHEAGSQYSVVVVVTNSACSAAASAAVPAAGPPLRSRRV